LTSDERENINQYDVEIRLIGDSLDPEPKKALITVPALAEKVQKASKLLEVGVPVKLFLTPLIVFNHISAEAFYRELIQDDLTNLMRFYDELVSLLQKRVPDTEGGNADM